MTASPPDHTTTIRSDREGFFRTVFDPTLNLEQILRAYLDYHGILFNDQRNHLRARINSELVKSGIELTADELIDAEDRLNLAILRQAYPSLHNSYFESVHAHTIPIEILPPSTRTPLADAIPSRVVQHARTSRRPAFVAHAVNEGQCTLMVGPHQYALFNRARGVIFSQVSSRTFSRSIDNYRRQDLKNPALLIQDYGDGSNFAHFLFDWTTRILHAFETRLATPGETVFFMGGFPTGLHKLIIDSLKIRYRLTDDAFVFPTGRKLFDLQNGIAFFSDAKMTGMHPAQMAHPKSVQLLRELCASIDATSGNIEKLYISRRDASLRRVSNEDDLIKIASSRGFVAVEMSGRSIQEQIALVKGARVIAAPHGMGLSLLPFHSGALRVIEIFHPNMGTDAYAMMAHALGFDYYPITGFDEKDGKGSYSVSVDDFKSALQ